MARVACSMLDAPNGFSWDARVPQHMTTLFIKKIIPLAQGVGFLERVEKRKN
jgi:hypothetical protein